jgi:hypothetical protein
VPGIFAMTGVLALAALAVVRWIVPDAPAGVHVPDSAAFWKALRDPELIRLNVGIFTLHAVLMAMFIVVPFALVRGGLPSSEHWWVYLSSVGAGIVLVLPVLISRASAHERRVFLVSVATIGVSLAVLALTLERLGGVIAALVIFFAGFNVLEAKLPALVSRAAPREARGAATGVYSSVQFLGTFFGAAAGGALAQHAGFPAVLMACLAVTAVGSPWHGTWAISCRPHRRLRALREGKRIMASVNKVIIVGNLGRDPETRYMPDGGAISNISVATTDKWKDKNGEMQEKTEWHRVAFFGKLAEIAGEYLKKGSQVYVEGPPADAQVAGQGRGRQVLDGDRRQPDADAGLAPGHGRWRTRGRSAGRRGGFKRASRVEAGSQERRQVRRLRG